MPNSRINEIYELKKRIFELEFKVAYHTQEFVENQKIIVKISAILAQLADDQHTLASHIFNPEDQKESKHHMEILTDEDDDLIN